MNENIGFLLNDTARLFRRAFDERCRDCGITGLQWRLLGTVRRHEGIHQAALADLIEVEPITLSRMIDRLDESGLVERRPDPNDRRARLIFLTDKAKDLRPVAQKLSGEIAEECLAGLSEQERMQLNKLVSKVRNNLSRREKEE